MFIVGKIPEGRIANQTSTEDDIFDEYGKDGRSRPPDTGIYLTSAPPNQTNSQNDGAVEGAGSMEMNHTPRTQAYDLRRNRDMDNMIRIRTSMIQRNSMMSGFAPSTSSRCNPPSSASDRNVDELYNLSGTDLLYDINGKPRRSLIDGQPREKQKSSHPGKTIVQIMAMTCGMLGLIAIVSSVIVYFATIKGTPLSTIISARYLYQ